MKKRLIRMTLVMCLVVTSLLWGGAVYAQDEELPKPGITPDSPFYFLDKWGKSINLFFTFGDEAKAKKALRYAEERLSEAQAMAAENKTREMTRAANDFDGFMAMVNLRLEAAARAGASDNVSEGLAVSAYRLHTRLGELKDRLATADGEAETAIEQAQETTINSQVNALMSLAKNKPERALDIGCETVERLMERARVRVRASDNATENATQDVDEVLDYASRIAALEDEMTAIAEEKGINITGIQARLAQSSANRLEVLSEVYENAPEAAQKGIENAIENSVKRYERAVEKLEEMDASVSVNATALQNIPEKVKEKLDVETTLARIEANIQNREQNREQQSNNQAVVSANQTQNQQGNNKDKG